MKVVPFDIERDHASTVDAYAEVFAEPPWDETIENVTWFARELYDYATSPGFRGAVLLDADDRVQGFTFGADWTSDNWWCEAVERELGSRAERWTAHCFHLIELAVRREHRGKGHGAALYDALVEALPHRTAILSTNRLGPVAAATLYARRGWKLLLEEWRHCQDCDSVQVLGLSEPAMSKRSNA